MPLSIEHLRAHGLSAAAVSAWRSGGIEHLLPLQEKVLTEHGFLHGKSLLVCAPTSSGKTFVAEMAAVRQMERNRRVVFLVPTKALAEEKYRSFSTLYGPQGYRVAISTRERPEADKDILTGDYDLLVAVYEKMKAYLVARPEMLVGVALVVADEIQTLGEPGRGAMIDLLLTKIAKAPYGSQLIALSAVVGEDAPRLAAWLGCELIHHRERPVELREGVFDLSRGEFNYRDAGTGRTGTEPLAEPFTSDDCFPDAEDVDFRREAILSLARNLSEERGEQVLLFVPTRYMSRNWAHHLAGRASLEPARDVLNEMALYEDTHARDLLREVLGNGIAFHNADLSWDLRDLIERHFNSGDIRVLISTPTLAQGVNLRGRNVLHVPAMIATDRWTGRSTTVPLTRGRFRNQGGRSGRYRHEEGFGRSILVARNPQESERLMRDYVEGHAEPLTPQIEADALGPYVLDLVASRVASTRAALAEFFHETFTGRVLWEAGAAPIAQRIEETVTLLVRRSLLVETPDGRLEATGLGEVAAASGLQPGTIERIVAWLREGPRVLCDEPLEALVVLAATPDARDVPAGDVGRPDAAEAWVGPIRERLLQRAEGTVASLGAILEPPGGITREALGDFKKALLLDAWIGPSETREIEENFRIFSGGVVNMASQFAWLAQGAAALARALTLPPEQRTALDQLADRLVLGCSPEGTVFRALRVPGLSRSYLRALLREGYDSIATLAAADEATLATLVPPSVAADLLAEAQRCSSPSGARRRPRAAPRNGGAVRETQGLGNASKRSSSARRQPKPAPSVSLSPDSDPDAEPACQAEGQPLLEIDLRGTGHARLNGHDLVLPRLPFRLLTILARSGELGASYAEIQEYVWPDAVVETQQVLAHRKRLEIAFGEVLSQKEAKRLIPVKPGVGLSLHLPAEGVRITE